MIKEILEGLRNKQPQIMFDGDKNGHYLLNVPKYQGRIFKTLKDIENILGKEEFDKAMGR